MKRYNKKLVVLAIVSVLLSAGMSYAKVRAVKARRDFEQSVAKESMVVALFYDDQKKDAVLRNKNKGLMRMYDDVSSYQNYDDADVIFLKVNSARKELYELAALYGVTTVPAFIFFHKGKRLVDKQGSPIMLTGFVSRDTLQSFIDTHYGVEVEQYIATKEARNKQRLEREGESWKPYFYPRDMFVPSYGPEERTLE
ncbi:MAG TPA: thioredoxin family protein [Candidatus Babeliales bacterium]|jgi:hypothetical protein|nr:thioredoxin family protein [Candidatus Babeliales bacterium]